MFFLFAFLFNGNQAAATLVAAYYFAMTPLFKKLNFKNQPEVLIIHAPQSFAPEMEAMATHTNVLTDVDAAASCSFILAFVSQQSEVDTLAPLLAQKLEGDGALWFCYPKGSSKKYTCNFNRDTGWQALAIANFEGVRMVAIDEDWSALRFRRVAFIKTMKRSFARSEEGKRKVNGGG